MHTDPACSQRKWVEWAVREEEFHWTDRADRDRPIGIRYIGTQIEI